MIKQFLDFFKSNKFNCSIVICYFLLTLFLAFNHELWRDETQAWCIVRDCNFREIFKIAQVEGHPLLWYIILLPFAKIGFPVETIQSISYLFVFLAVIYITFKTNINNYLKIVFIFSSGIFYYLPIIARSYSLIPILLLLTANYYKKRKEHPFIYSILLILIANTHVMMLAFCFVLFVFFLFETLKNKSKNNILALSLMGINFLILFLMFNNLGEGNHSVNHYNNNVLPLVDSLGYFAKIYFIYPLNNLGQATIFIFYLLLLILIGVLCKNNFKIGIIFLTSLIFQFYLMHRVWYHGIAYQKAFLIMLIIMFCYIVIENKKKILTIIIGTFFTISTIGSYFTFLLEKDCQFSGSKQVKEYIQNNLDEINEFYVIGYPFTFTSISAYLPDKKFYSTFKEDYVSYHDFLYRKTEKKEPPQSKYYIVQFPYTLDNSFEEIFSTDDLVISNSDYQEIFKIYKKK